MIAGILFILINIFLFILFIYIVLTCNARSCIKKGL